MRPKAKGQVGLQRVAMLPPTTKLVRTKRKSTSTVQTRQDEQEDARQPEQGQEVGCARDQGHYEHDVDGQEDEARHQPA